ncbi:MAG: hypothetical protein ABIB93_02805 [Chloroflexota bacterium]
MSRFQQSSAMQLRVKPVIILNNEESTFRHSDGTREVITDREKVSLRVAQLSKELKEKLHHSIALLDDAIVTGEESIAGLKAEALKADALLVCPIGTMSLKTLLQWKLPIIAFSGQYTPTQALYAFGVERHRHPDITVALDFQDIDDALQRLEARKRLRNSRIALVGFPPSRFSHWHHLPDLELAQEKFGTEFIPVELRELLAKLPEVDTKEAQSVAGRWIKEAKEVVEPSKTDVVEAARIYLSLADILEREKANALALNCDDMMNSLQASPPCYALTRLRDEGIHAACEVDVVILLTMMLLGYLTDKPAFMGNIVGAIPETNTLRISHCVLPTRMAGLNQPPSPYTLRNYHGYRRGVTAHVELDTGQEVTIARLSRNLDRIMLLNGELIDCQETIACRTTLSARVNDVREFVRCAFGNHHVIVYGNHVRQAKILSQALGISSIEL